MQRLPIPLWTRDALTAWLNFFAERDLQALEVISRGEYMAFGMQGKDIRQHLENISPSAMSRIFKRLRLHGIIERVQGTYKYFATAYAKRSLPQDLLLETLCLYQHWHKYFSYAEILPFCAKNH
ncbi:MarR family transcriptional regulator [Petralouisia muris]|uniref:MarR family transcriptional regulator n=1 Tax=Petralouisia muris TaxID=3032872 RepID=UPI0023B80078|nr:helix-turn-helix domain-containing protein [Petralouisia muris]